MELKLLFKMYDELVRKGTRFPANAEADLVRAGMYLYGGHTYAVIWLGDTVIAIVNQTLGTIYARNSETEEVM